MRAIETVDVLLVSPRTTAGWRRTDDELVRALEELGLTVTACTSDYRIVRHLRRTMALTDLAEAAAMRRSLTRALRRYRPRAIIYSTPQATMLQPRRRIEGATAVRFDALTTLNRPGVQNGLQHWLERRNLARVTVLLPSGLEPGERVTAELSASARVVALPVPIEPGPDASRTREPIALSYAGNPSKKGLDLIVQA